MVAGRRPGESGTREAIRMAARASFAERGYERTTIRKIAADAGVDPALVHHYFQNKDGLFLAALELPVHPAEVIRAAAAADPNTIGETMVGAFLAIWDDEVRREVLFALLRGAVSHEPAAMLMREFIEKVMLGVIAEVSDRPDAGFRGTLIGSHLVGLAMLRYIVKVEPLASAPAEDVAALVGPAIQRYITA